MNGVLAEHVALVTGGGQGIGRGVSHALAKAGAAVAVVGRTESKCVAVADELTALGARAIAVKCDVTKRADVDAAVSRTVEEFGGLDILVNNAQSSNQGALVDVTVEDIELSWHSGAMATFYAMQAAFPHLKASANPCIVNFGSTTAIEGNKGFGAYAMAKEAIRGLSRVAAREWGPHGIRVNIIVPNALSPAMEEFRDANPERFERMQKAVPLGRVGDPETDIGGAVVALADKNLTYMSGQTLMLTGGA